MDTVAAASPWVQRFVPWIPAGGSVLDLACGGGRNTRLLRASGHPVTAVDIDLSGVADLADDPDVERMQADLEDGSPFPLIGRTFTGIVVTCYLHRPLLPALLDALAPGGLLIYETFAVGQERFGRPANPDFLLEPGELLDVVRGVLHVDAYEDVVDERPSRVQRICASRASEPADAAPRSDAPAG